ncbi:MAG: RNA polymerase factor sigma-54 [Verrucomicrobia bacterium]|nr:RNA polymerase factor sigma-54 [Verrucomicrobiota bacterium]MDA1065712.1 RNA polymerase factor sigma-54 [Verrucomicrobiota bacterium]
MPSQGLHQYQKQIQSLILAPQLRQSLKILQAPTMELRNEILGELQSNPALEELPMDGDSLESSLEIGAEDNTPDQKDEMDFDKDFDLLSKMDEASRDYYAQEYAMSSYSSDDAERRQHFFDSLASSTSLQEHLIHQADLSNLDEDQHKAINYLIGSLDDRGYLTSKLPDLALLAQLPLRVIQEAHTLLKTLDPAGIGAVDLQDCLLIQIKINGRAKSLAGKMLKDQFHLLLRRRIPEIAKRVNKDIEDVQEALEEISNLDPSPGRKYGEDTNQVITPDVVIEKDAGKWKIHLNNEYIPRLRISNVYKEIIARGKLTKEEKEYIQEKMRAGKFLISSIEQRQQTIEKITRSILDFQLDFFEEGLVKLRPLTMTQVADAVGVHETTVSRAISGKYIKTPHGIFPLKYFFTPGYDSAGGEALSNTTIKDMIAHIIENEDPGKPLSDQVVVNLLAEKNITIARRTVAKYREELGILPTNLRRRYH